MKTTPVNSNSLQTKNILLVENELSAALPITAILKDHGFTTTVAASGEDALRMIEDDPSIELVLMDIELGEGMDGTEAARLILEIRELPLIFLVSRSGCKNIEKTEVINSYGFITNETQPPVIVASIKTALRLFNRHKDNIKNEKLLEEREFFFQESLRAGNLGLYKYDYQTGQYHSSDILNEIYGIDESFEMGPDTWTQFLHPDDRDMVLDKLQKSIASQTGLETEHRIIRFSDKAVRWIHTISVIKYDSNGKIIYASGTVKDVTERRKEELLQKEREKIARTILDNIPQHIFWKDTESTYLGCNKSFAESSGLDSTQDIIGKNDFDLPFPRWLAESYRGDDAFVMENNKAKYHFNEHFLNAEKQMVILDTTKIPLVDKDGEVYGIIGVFDDITEQKKKEKQIQSLLVEKDIFLREIHHRMKNNIAIIESLLTLQLNAEEKKDVDSILIDVVGRVKSVKVLYDRLFVAEEYRHISTRNYFESLIDAILNLFSGSETITLHKEIEDFTIDPKTVTTLGIILNELITNAIKHAFNETNNKKLKIVIGKKKSRLSLLIADNGPGIDSKKDISQKSLGYQLIDLLVKQLGGTYTLRNNNGTECLIECACD